MKPILYGEHEKEFNTNGIGILSDAVDCNVDIQLNGICELELLYPVTGIHFESISQRAIVLAKVDPVSEPQPFRIYRITKPMNGKVTVYARHVAYDLMGIPVSPFTADNAPAAMLGLKENAVTECPFSFWTDKATPATLNAKVPTAAWNLLGGTQGSILDTYGGEYEFDRWDVKLHNHRGADRGVAIRYGKNLTSLEQDENIANCYTGVYPYWTNAEGVLVQLTEKTVAAEGTFSYTRIKPVDFSAEWTEEPTQEQLRARAEKYIRDNDIGKPRISWKVEFVALEQTEEYKGRELLEQILLGDTVTVMLPKLNINVSARAVAARYKPLLDRYAYVTLGSVKANIADTIVQQQQEIAQKPSDSLVQSVVMTLTAAILGAKGGAVRLLDTDNDGMPDTLYVADNADPDLAVKVWRWNYEGWAGSRTGYNGPFILGATLEDGLLAEAVTAANLIAGTIKSKDGKTFYLDLDNGILRMQATEFSISGKTVDEIAEGKASAAVSAQTQQDIFNKWSDNGKIQGVFAENGVWVINAAVAVIQNLVAEMITAGVLKSKDGKIAIDLSGSAAEFFGGISTNGLIVRGDQAGAQNLLKAEAVQGSSGNYFFRTQVFSVTGKEIGKLVETFTSEGEHAGVSFALDSQYSGRRISLAAGESSAQLLVTDKDGYVKAAIGSQPGSGKGIVQTDILSISGDGNCKWEYISDIGKTVLVQV